MIIGIVDPLQGGSHPQRGIFLCTGHKNSCCRPCRLFGRSPLFFSMLQNAPPLAFARVRLQNAPRIVLTPLANYPMQRIKTLYEPKNALLCCPCSAVALHLRRTPLTLVFFAFACFALKFWPHVSFCQLFHALKNFRSCFALASLVLHAPVTTLKSWHAKGAHPERVVDALSDMPLLSDVKTQENN